MFGKKKKLYLYIFTLVIYTRNRCSADDTYGQAQLKQFLARLLFAIVLHTEHRLEHLPRLSFILFSLMGNNK